MVVVHTAQGEQLIPAGSVQPGMSLFLANDQKGLTTVTEVTVMDPSTTRGLANILTGTETIVVNGLIGSHLAVSNVKSRARFVLKKLHSVIGAKGTRCVYRAMEWALDNFPKLKCIFH